jgi:hypothetical protein
MGPDFEIAGLKFYSRSRLAEELRLSRQTLACWKSRGIGPNQISVGRHVLYPLEAVKEYLAKSEK